MEVCSLEESPEKWAEHILKVLDCSLEQPEKRPDWEGTEGKEKETGNGREAYAQKIAAVGYGIQEAAQGMEQFYQKHWPLEIDVEKHNDMAKEGMENIFP